MTDYAALLAERFPIRKTAEQRQAFQEWLTAELKSLGYKAKEETNGHFKAHNILVGDPEKTAVLFVTHMDTPARWLLPDMLFPRNYFLWGMWQLLHMGLLLIPTVLVYLGIWQIYGQNAQLGLWGLVLTYLALLLLSQYGPANPVNRGEDADLAAMLTLMASLPEEDRGKAAFLFTDRGAVGGMGAKAWAKEHPIPAYTRLTVAFARIGTGDHLVMPATKLAVKSTGFGSLVGTFERDSGHQVERCSSVACTIRGERKAFRCGMSITGCHHSSILGLWCKGGHTPADRELDLANIEAVSRCCASFLSGLKLSREAHR
ncbi:MAG: hypothetical protein IK127_02880 [Clostridia bacterium]|nr:hypothetical protein [Clostridia bacterium]